jgi:formate transporter FocA
MQNVEIRTDAFAPAEMAAKAEQVGVKKSGQDFFSLLVLGILAGAFIGLGAVFSTTVTAGIGDKLPYGITRLISGFSFCLGLILVVVGGAELFTGNALIIMAWASRQVSTGALLRNWGIVYLGNFIGALVTAGLTVWSGQYANGAGAVGALALATANAKVHLGFMQAVVLGILCNGLVCMAVWLTYSARSTADRILAVIFPVTAFVAAGYEHSVANMYFIPVGILIKAFAPASFWTAIAKTPVDFAQLTWGSFLINNLLPVTIGNIIGGTLLVGAMYWLAYRRKEAAK